LLREIRGCKKRFGEGDWRKAIIGEDQNLGGKRVKKDEPKENKYQNFGKESSKGKVVGGKKGKGK